MCTKSSSSGIWENKLKFQYTGHRLFMIYLCSILDMWWKLQLLHQFQFKVTSNNWLEERKKLTQHWAFQNLGLESSYHRGLCHKIFVLGFVQETRSEVALFLSFLWKDACSPLSQMRKTIVHTPIFHPCAETAYNRHKILRVSTNIYQPFQCRHKVKSDLSPKKLPKEWNKISELQKRNWIFSISSKYY